VSIFTITMHIENKIAKQ